MNNPIMQAFIAGALFELGFQMFVDWLTTNEHPTTTALTVTAGIFAFWWYVKLLDKWHVRQPDEN